MNGNDASDSNDTDDHNNKQRSAILGAHPRAQNTHSPAHRDESPEHEQQQTKTNNTPMIPNDSVMGVGAVMTRQTIYPQTGNGLKGGVETKAEFQLAAGQTRPQTAPAARGIHTKAEGRAPHAG